MTTENVRNKVKAMEWGVYLAILTGKFSNPRTDMVASNIC